MTTSVTGTSFTPHSLEVRDENQFDKLLFEATSLDQLPELTDTIMGDPNSPVGILLIHGYSGSNLELLYLGNYLGLRGCRVAIPLLPGHGTNYQDLTNYTYKDWIAKGEAAYQYLSSEHPDRDIIGIGHSMGGSIMFNLAYHFDFKGMISLAAPIKYPFYLRMMVKVAEKTNLNVPFENLQFHNEQLLDHPAVKHLLKKYEKVPLQTLGDIFEIIEGAYNALPQVDIPVYLIYSREDTIVPPYHVKAVVDDLTSGDIEIAWLYHSSHILVIDSDRQLVGQKIWSFINRVLNRIGSLT